MTATPTEAPSRRQLLLAGLLLPLACLTGGPAFAHREKTLFTTIQYNPRSGMLEVIHRAYAHDVEHTLGNQLRARGGLENLEARARVSLELAQAFALWDASTGERIALQLVGAELEGEFLYIYQEAGLPGLPRELEVRDLMLRNHWPDMTNFVNVMYEGGVASLLFEGGTETLSVSAPD